MEIFFISWTHLRQSKQVNSTPQFLYNARDSKSTIKSTRSYVNTAHFNGISGTPGKVEKQVGHYIVHLVKGSSPLAKDGPVAACKGGPSLCPHLQDVVADVHKRLGRVAHLYPIVQICPRGAHLPLPHFRQGTSSLQTL